VSRWSVRSRSPAGSHSQAFIHRNSAGKEANKLQLPSVPPLPWNSVGGAGDRLGWGDMSLYPEAPKERMLLLRDWGSARGWWWWKMWTGRCGQEGAEWREGSGSAKAPVLGWPVSAASGLGMQTH